MIHMRGSPALGTGPHPRAASIWAAAQADSRDRKTQGRVL